MEYVIKIPSKDKITTIRVSESTKRQLERVNIGTATATHEDIIKKLINLAKIQESETILIKNKNISGTKYARLNKTLNIELEKNRYSLVCTYNDVSLVNYISSNKSLLGDFPKEWEIDLEIVNIGILDKNTVHWKEPKLFYEKNTREFLLLHLIAVKQILEDMFLIKISEILTEGDYLNPERWRSAYQRNKLSMESYYKDIEKRIKDAT